MLTLEHKLAIHDLIALYGHIVDERQFSRTHEVFTEDAVYDVSDFGAGVHVGHQAVAALWALPTSLHPLAHHATNVIVSEDASGVVRVASKGIGLRPDGRTGSVTYHDVVEHRPEGWRITKRVAVARHPDRIPLPS
jgi:ketosteroid isomerase-like protein